jgi:hypothetical protein
LERVGEILKTILDPETERVAESWHTFFSSWESLVGPDLAGLTRLVEVERHEAVVEVEHPAAAQLLGLHREDVLARIRRDFPEVAVRGLRVKVRPPGDGALSAR